MDEYDKALRLFADWLGAIPGVIAASAEVCTRYQEAWCSIRVYVEADDPAFRAGVYQVGESLVDDFPDLDFDFYCLHGDALPLDPGKRFYSRLLHELLEADKEGE